jgi:hypothetical protein
MVLPVNIGRSFGVLEYWSIGVLGKANASKFNLDYFSPLHYSTTPSLQQTAARGERPVKPPAGYFH